LSIRNTNNDDEDALLGLIHDDLLDGLHASLDHHTLEVSGCAVDTLRIAYGIDDHHMRHHTDRIIALADVRKIRITVPYVGPKWLRVDAGLLPVACHMEIALFGHRVSALTRPKRCRAVGALPPPRSLRAP
jgi:hypothetical protein